MNHYKYLPNQADQHICHICKKEFNKIYEDNIKMHISNTIILNELIRSLKSNVEELQLENDILNKSLKFYRDLSLKSIQQRF
jgi:hypothetical protein